MLKLFFAVFVMFFVLESWAGVETPSYLSSVDPMACFEIVKNQPQKKVERIGVNFTYIHFHFGSDDSGKPLAVCKKRLEYAEMANFFKKQNKPYPAKGKDCLCEGYFIIKPVVN